MCVSEGCNSSITPSADASHQRLYSPSNHVSPGKSCVSKRPTSSGSATTPPCGVLKNVMVSHHMDRSSSTPRLTLKFQHVKRHENGIATTAADVPRSDGASQLLAVASSGSRTTTSSISSVDPRYLTASLPSVRHHAADHVFKSGFEKIHQNHSPAEQTPLSSQFEDISDAEDEVRPSTTASSRDSSSTIPDRYGLPLPSSQCLPPLPVGLYPSANSSAFCSSAATVIPSFPSLVDWNSLSAFTMSSGQPSDKLVHWRNRNLVVNHFSSLPFGGSPVPTPDGLLSRQALFNNRFFGRDGSECPKSEFLHVKSEVPHTSTSSGHHTPVNSEHYNGHVGDELYIKAESLESARELCPSTVESKPTCTAVSDVRLEETFKTSLPNSNHDTSTSSWYEDRKDKGFKSDLCGNKPNLHNGVQIKADVDNTSSSCYSPGRHSPDASISSSMRSSCLEPSTAVDPFSSSTETAADVSQIPNNLEPKVPPLRIIIPSKVCPPGSLSDGTFMNTTSRSSVSSLPYVVSQTNSADSDTMAVTVDTVHRCDSSPAVFTLSDDRLSTSKESLSNSDLVPAKRRKIKHSSKVSGVVLFLLANCHRCFCGFPSCCVTILLYFESAVTTDFTF